MAGVEAHTQSSRAVERRHDRGEVLEAVTEDRALARGVLQKELRGARGVRREYRADALGDSPKPFILGARRVGTGMEHDSDQSERIRPPKLLDQRIDRALSQRGVRGGQIDEVARVRHDRAHIGVIGLLTELLNLCVREGARLPPVRCCGKDLNRLTAGGHRAIDGPAETAGNRHVGVQARTRVTHRTRSECRRLRHLRPSVDHLGARRASDSTL